MYDRLEVTQIMDEADRVEDEQMDRDAADLMRKMLFTRQISQLQRAIGVRVRVVSKGYFSKPPEFQLNDGEVSLDLQGFSVDGGTAAYEGKLSRVDRLLSILIDKDDGSGSDGLPFVGASSIREVTRGNDGRLLYFNPRIDDEFHSRFIHSSRRQMSEMRRRMFGTDGAEF